MLKKHAITNIFVLFFLMLFCVCAYPQDHTSNTIKIALLDTPYNEMPLNLSLLSEYEKAYLAGAEAATQAAKKFGWNIQYKPFFYGSGPLDILSEVPKIRDWQADLVIGPSSSDQFLLLRNHLRKTMVLSSYASDVTLKTLPENFYSLYIPDDYQSKALATFVQHKFPTKNVYIVAQVDCKQCVDMGKLFATYYQTISSTTKVVQSNMLLDDINTLDIKKIMAGHENDVILPLTTTYDGYNTLLKRIASFYPQNNLAFFTDQDNWGSATQSDMQGKKLPYQNYRIAPLLSDSSSSEFKNFEHVYRQIYHTEPNDAVSYVNYLTIMSAIAALDKFPSHQADMRAKLLSSYLAALKQDPNWFRAKKFVVYLLTPHGEVIVGTVPLSKVKN